MYKKAWCTCKVVVLLIKPMVFFRFSLPSASLDLKVPISSSHTLSSSRVFLKTEVFFLRFSIPSMRKRRFRAPKMQVFYKVLECRFWKTPVSRLRVDERKRWCHASEPLALRVLRIRCYRISIVLVFSCGRTNTLSVDVCFWKRREKNIWTTTMTTATKTLLINLLFKKPLLWFFRLA